MHYGTFYSKKYPRISDFVLQKKQFDGLFVPCYFEDDTFDPLKPFNDNVFYPTADEKTQHELNNINKCKQV